MGEAVFLSPRHPSHALPLHHILVDYENVQPDAFSLLDRDDFRVHVFVGARQKQVPIETAVSMQALGARAGYVRISGSGRNALDFHLALHIGLLAARAPESFFHILSKDTGFEPLLAHLEGMRVAARRHECVSRIPEVVAEREREAGERARRVREKLRSPKAPRPRTLAALENHLAHLLGAKPDLFGIAAVVERLEGMRFLAVNGGNIAYLEAPETDAKIHFLGEPREARPGS